mgnify:CR=1 FL=1
MATRAERQNAEAVKQNTQDTLELKSKIADMEKKAQGRREDIIKKDKNRVKILQEEAKEREAEKKALNEISDGYSEVGDRAKAIGDSIDGFVKSIPGGEFLAKAFGVDDLGKKMQDEVIGRIQESYMGTQDLGKGFKMAFTPLSLGIAGFTAIFALIRKIRSANRELATSLGVTTSEAGKFQIPLKAAEMQFNLMGLNSENLKSTLGAIGKEFGSLENMTVANAKNIERFAQNSGVAGTEIVKFNKVMMDLTGSSFSVATNMAKTAADMARSANVSTAKVLGDISSSAEDFARFSMDGANGLAQAAVEAAKVGANLESILGAADKLLDFETSISNQFKAQVLSGKQINTERARQLALDGDIAGLTAEIQSIVGQVGDIQTLNVIQRKSVADAIGISVQDLLRISRGEQAEAQETVQDKLDTTNAILAKQYDIAVEDLEVNKDKEFTISQGPF